jgi:hypothetical protein
MRPAIHFQGGDLSALVQEVSQFLREEDFPGFDGFLFCVDGELIEYLEDKNPWYRSVLNRRMVPRRLFKSPELFREDFERCCRGDWMHLKIYGVLNGSALLGIQSNLDSTYISPSPVRITLTRFDKEPFWGFEREIKRPDPT